jgi:hypothetical protein
MYVDALIDGDLKSTILLALMVLVHVTDEVNAIQAGGTTKP